jgi:hypothetical protein
MTREGGRLQRNVVEPQSGVYFPPAIPVSDPTAAPTMHHFLDKLSGKGKAKESHHPNASPPQWTPAVERSHTYGKYEDAAFDEYKEAERFCARHPVERAKLLPSDMTERLSQEGCNPWGMRLPSSPRFKGRVESGIDKGGTGVTKIVTDRKCKDVCIFSDLPIMAGLYDTKGKQGVYYEVVVRKMEGIIAIGDSCSMSAVSCITQLLTRSP